MPAPARNGEERRDISERTRTNGGGVQGTTRRRCHRVARHSVVPRLRERVTPTRAVTCAAAAAAAATAAAASPPRVCRRPSPPPRRRRHRRKTALILPGIRPLLLRELRNGYYDLAP